MLTPRIKDRQPLEITCLSNLNALTWIEILTDTETIAIKSLNYLDIVFSKVHRVTPRQKRYHRPVPVVISTKVTRARKYETSSSWDLETEL